MSQCKAIDVIEAGAGGLVVKEEKVEQGWSFSLPCCVPSIALGGGAGSSAPCVSAIFILRFGEVMRKYYCWLGVKRAAVIKDRYKGLVLYIYFLKLNESLNVLIHDSGWDPV